MKDLQKLINQFCQKYECTLEIKQRSFYEDCVWVTVQNLDFKHTMVQTKLNLKEVIKEYRDICKMIENFKKQQKENGIFCVVPFSHFPALYAAKKFVRMKDYPASVTVTISYYDRNPITKKYCKTKKSFTV